MSYDEFKNQMIGQIVDDGNGGYKGQCVSLVKRWIAANGWPYKHGNAIDWQNNGDDFYHWVPNSPTAVPVQGDIIVFKVGTYGHIGIVESANVNTTDVLNQNYPKGNLTDPVQVTRFNYISPKVVGWLHPAALDAPTPPPAPQEDPKDAQIRNLTAENNALKDECSNYINRLQEKDQTIQTLENEKKSLSDQLTSVVSAKDDLSKQLSDISGQLEAQAKEIATLKDEISKLDAECESYKFQLDNPDKKAIALEYLRELINKMFGRRP